MLFTKLTLCSQIRNIVLKVAMNLVFIYLGEECLVIIYSVSELAMGKVPVCLQPDSMYQFHFEKYVFIISTRSYVNFVTSTTNAYFECS